MEITLEAKKVVRVLVVLIVGLFVAHLSGQFIRFGLGHPYVFGLVPMFDLDQEKNIPTFYATVTLFICAALLAAIALAQRGKGKYFRHWTGLSLIFLFLSVDEAAVIHEKLNEPLRELLGSRGIFHFAWVIFYGVVLLGLAVVYFRFLFDLPRKSQILFVVAGGVYVMGVLGVELIGAGQFLRGGWSDNVQYAIVATIEEMLEMSGIALFIYALLAHIAADFKEIRIKVG